MSSRIFTRQQYGNAFEMVVLKRMSHDLEHNADNRWIDSKGRKMRRRLIFGGSLTSVHRSILFEDDDKDKLEERLVRYAKVAFREQSQQDARSNTKGFDALLVVEDEKTGLICKIEEIIETKCNKSYNALKTTCQLAVDLRDIGRMYKFRIVHDNRTNLKQTDINWMREKGIDVVVESCEVSDKEAQEELYGNTDEGVDMDVETTNDALSDQTYVSRPWVPQQMNLFEKKIRTDKILRLTAEVGMGKSDAAAEILQNSYVKTRFQICCVLVPTLGSAENMESVLMKHEIEYESADCRTSGQAKYDYQEVSEDEHNRRRIKNMLHDNLCKIKQDSTYNPKVIVMLYGTLHTFFDILVEDYPDERVFLLGDEYQTFKDVTAIQKCLDMPNVKFLQLAAESLCYDRCMKRKDPRIAKEWCVEPYFNFKYGDGVKNGYLVPVNIHIIKKCETELGENSIYNLVKNIILLYPRSTIVQLPFIKDVRQMANKYKKEFANSQNPEKKIVDKVFTMHSEMGKDKTTNGFSSAKGVLEYLRNHPDENVVIFTCRMTNNSINIPRMKNFINLCTSEVNMDDHKQRVGRIARQYGGEIGGYFTFESNEVSCLEMKLSYDDDNNMQIYEMGSTELISSCENLRSMTIQEVSQEKNFMNQATKSILYKHAFPLLASESLKVIQTVKERENIIGSEETISVTVELEGKDFVVTENLRKVTDDIVQTRIHMNKREVCKFELAQNFQWPEYTSCLKNQGRSEEIVYLADGNGEIGFTITDEHYSLLDSRHARSFTEEELEEVKYHIDSENNFQRFMSLWKMGEVTIKKKNNKVALIKIPEFKNALVNIRVEEILKKYRELLKKNDKDDFIKWAWRRIKLLQAKLVNHPKYMKKYSQSIARVQNNLEKRTKKKESEEMDIPS